MGEVATTRRRAVTQYDPEKGLKSIAVAEAGEKHWTRAKDADKLFKAIDAKIEEQADYVVWRDSVAKPAGRPKNSFRSERVLPEADPGHVVAHRWRKAFCSRDENGKTAKDEVKLEKVRSEVRERCRRLCEQEKTVRGTEGTGENEWFTPAEFIERARKVLGVIDLDPASNPIAQETVLAASFFTKEDNGLEREWNGRVWLNPPYAQPFIAQFISKLVAEIRAGRVTAAISLTHNYTDTSWFHEAMEVADAICFTRGRVKFYEPNGEVAAPTQGQAFSYFGNDVALFAETFSDVGFVVRPVRGRVDE